ncbi:AraC family transcriptional regulator [Ulvibacterium sp.]|uniref:helix-turn-helix domain-containing protein n=1 Tax=Ulvibacterium sp. TaxID=2665914 RepID=UPI002613B0D3|nr:helix-turn-helix domain-containing protein [Ulvibacterium sp.]
MTSLVFPSFNLYSTPLLVLVSQGLLFGGLLLHRFYTKRRVSDLFLALLVIITCYHRTTYTIGFMDWYDTYRNTKINYWLISLSLAIGPLIYFYVKSVTTSNFKFGKKDGLHFVPVAIYALYRIFIFVYDAGQSGFDEKQNGILMEKWAMGAVGSFAEAFNAIQQILYLAFSLQLYFAYRKKIRDYFSNIYKLELNWIRNFLYIYSFLFLYGILQQFIILSVVELSWIQKWWYQFFSALAVIYIGIKGYFTDTTSLEGLDFQFLGRLHKKETSIKESMAYSKLQPVELENLKERLSSFMKAQRPYLNPDLNLKEMAQDLQMSRGQLSEVINIGFGKNFNDFINTYRINSVKNMLKEGKHEKLSLLGIAFECGFNSKATFNRVFKKFTNHSPTEFLKNSV